MAIICVATKHYYRYLGSEKVRDTDLRILIVAVVTPCKGRFLQFVLGIFSRKFVLGMFSSDHCNYPASEMESDSGVGHYNLIIDAPLCMVYSCMISKISFVGQWLN